MTTTRITTALPTTPPPRPSHGRIPLTHIHPHHRHPNPPTQPARRDDRGQASAEYAMVILAAATLALGVVTWATHTGAITGIFQAVVDRLTSSI